MSEPRNGVIHMTAVGGMYIVTPATFEYVGGFDRLTTISVFEAYPKILEALPRVLEQPTTPGYLSVASIFGHYLGPPDNGGYLSRYKGTCEKVTVPVDLGY
jgi:hypothetical protein